ncbi:Hypothetical protein AJAP_42435 (plasmid) [Amycolatopsis japonica]|uniref:Uncharacterized protein n=1 Tax=Amycolatopsis japonica TaxID=208439 RepID=A0A075V735_9PSEU|nr:hypothetical protein [Amycolatopsis japonica]AIG81258.1 Hypothetical protein AJAP_42435 [Amycolatopsis japonica]
MVLIRKDRAGSDSYGHTWGEDGAVVDVAPEHAADLLEIPDGGFHEAEPVDEPEPVTTGLVDLEALAAQVAAEKAAAAATPDVEPEADLAGLAARKASTEPETSDPAPEVEPETPKPRGRGGSRKTA